MRIRTAVAATAFVVLGGQVATVQAEVVIETVTVGNPGNAGELSGECVGGGGGPCRECGAVDYVYSIGKYEVTARQYAEFLNAVASDDTYGLYTTSMANTAPVVGGYGCNIHRSAPPPYTYSVAPAWADRPVNHVSWGDAARFANWLHNGQPTGAQDLTTTEDGSYDLFATHAYYGPDGEIIDPDGLDAALMAVVAKEDATWVIPSEDEWYKAAYHYNDGVTGNYWNYPTQSSDRAPTAEAPPGTNMTSGSANYYGSGGFAIGSPYYRNEVGAYDAKPSDSPYDTFDQGGNVFEWNEAIVFGSHRGLRGGASGSYGASALHASNRIYDYAPTVEYHSSGLRVAIRLSVCGDGVLTFGEACDDGNTDNGDGCSSTCTVEDGFFCWDEPSVCVPWPGIPTVPEWGLVTMALLVLTAGTLMWGRRLQLTHSAR